MFYLRWEQREVGARRNQRLLQGETRHWCFVLETEALMWYVGQMVREEGGRVGPGGRGTKGRSTLASLCWWAPTAGHLNPAQPFGYLITG